MAGTRSGNGRVEGAVPMKGLANFIVPQMGKISQRELKETLIWISDDGKTVKLVYPKEFFERVSKPTHENDKR